MKPDDIIVQEAVSRLANIHDVPGAYAIDFGVMANGKAALIEMNEGYSIDSYDVDWKAYGKVLSLRWNEIS